jgi:hypothetical protein
MLPATSTATTTTTTTMAAAANSVAPRRPADLRARRAKASGAVTCRSRFCLPWWRAWGPHSKPKPSLRFCGPRAKAAAGYSAQRPRPWQRCSTGHPPAAALALDKALGPVARQRLSDLFLLSCLALPSPPTSTQAGAALGSAPLLLPPPVAPTAPTSTVAAFAWADAVLFLHGRAAAVAAPFGQLAAAGRQRCPWLWPALRAVDWANLAEADNPPRPSGLLGLSTTSTSTSSNESTVPNTSKGRAAAVSSAPLAPAAAAAAAATTTAATSPLVAAFAPAAQHLRVRRAVGARDLAVVVDRC